MSLYCYGQQYYGLDFFYLFIYFALDLKVKGQGCDQLVKCWPVSGPALHKSKPKYGGGCLCPQAGWSEVQGHSGLHGEVNLSYV